MELGMKTDLYYRELLGERLQNFGIRKHSLLKKIGYDIWKAALEHPKLGVRIARRRLRSLSQAIALNDV